MSEPLTPAADAAPVTPIGVWEGQLFLLDGLGQFRRISARDADAGRGLADLFLGGSVNGLDAEAWLQEFFPPKRERKQPDAVVAWSKADAGTWLIKACQQRGMYDPDTEIRRIGVWRDGDRAVAHCGSVLIDGAGELSDVGVLRAGAVYAASPGASFRRLVEDLPTPGSAADVLDLYESARDGWRWRRPGVDATAWVGWLGAAALGGFPEWRPHLWVSGRKGSGKSQLVKLAASVLGPLSGQVYNDFSPAGVRQRANGQARPHLFDEAERDGSVGRVEGVIEMARTMSGGAGSVAVRGGTDHTSVSFSLQGAVYLSSIIPGRLEPQDRSRFVMLELLARHASDDPARDARRLTATQEAGRKLGDGFWRRMLARASEWDAAQELASAYVQRLGGEPRDGETIGALLAGWHLATSDAALDEEALDELRDVAAALLDDARAAQEEGEGERCLAHLMQSVVHLGAGEVWRVSDLVWRAVQNNGDDSEKAGRRLTRCAIRHSPALRGEKGRGRLWVVGGQHLALDNIFRGTRWAQGGHRQALMMLEGVNPDPVPRRIGGHQARVLEIPERYWPDFKEEDGV